MKVNILYNFRPGPYGGGNQFLKALRKEFVKMKVYSADPGRVDIILVNSHHSLGNAIRRKSLGKVFIHRIDGPVFDVRGKDKTTDKLIFRFNELFSDGTIFQSNWSRQKCYLRGLQKSKHETVIVNASDSDIFNTKEKQEFKTNRKIKLISTSWSSNWRKGFNIYKFLDENLDFSKYEMTFVGNSPIKFANIKYIKPLPPDKLADLLKRSDIFVIGSQNDPCSNSLIEALSCGLPAVALNDGGHPELIQKGGELFNGREDVIEKIEKVAQNYHYYQSQIPEFSIERVTQNYYEFAQKIYEETQNKKYNPKQISFLTVISFYKMKFMILKWRGWNKIKAAKDKLWPE